MSFAFAFRSEQRIKMFDEKGLGQLEQKSNNLDTSYLQLLAPKADANKQENAKPDAEDEVRLWPPRDGG